MFQTLSGVKKRSTTRRISKSSPQTKGKHGTTTCIKRWHVLVLLSGCASITCKIDPPPNVIGTGNEMAAKAAANNLATAISGASAVVDYYHDVVNRTYDTVGQDDVAFYLLLQAYDCESARGNAAGAAEILQLAREELARRHNQPPPSRRVAATSNKLTKTEEHVLRKSPLKGAISSKLAQPTVDASPAPTPVAATPAASPSPKPPNSRSPISHFPNG